MIIDFHRLFYFLQLKIYIQMDVKYGQGKVFGGVKSGEDFVSDFAAL